MKNASRASILPVVIFSLAIFAVLKISNVYLGAAGVQAQMSTTQNPDAHTPEIVLASSETPQRDAPPPLSTPGETERRILEQLSARREILDDREDAIRARETLLAVAEKQLTEKIAEFERERAQLVALRSEQDEEQAQEIEALVSAYERMKSKDAAVIFNALDQDILVPVASGMRTQALAGVLAEMQPEKARELTKMLAERNRRELAAVVSESE